MKRSFITFPAFLLLMAATQAGATWVNEPAPSFELTDLDGDKRKFEPDSRGVVFINFWASWCPPCKEEFPKLNKLAADYQGKGVRVIAVTLDKALANVNKFLEKIGANEVNVEILRDPEGKAAKAYAARAMPVSFVVDKKGIVRFVHMGFQKTDEAKWREEIDALLKE